jgi:hypothetical protein
VYGGLNHEMGEDAAALRETWAAGTNAAPAESGGQ